MYFIKIIGSERQINKKNTEAWAGSKRADELVGDSNPTTDLLFRSVTKALKWDNSTENVKNCDHFQLNSGIKKKKKFFYIHSFSTGASDRLYLNAHIVDVMNGKYNVWAEFCNFFFFYQREREERELRTRSGNTSHHMRVCCVCPLYTLQDI